MLTEATALDVLTWAREAIASSEVEYQARYGAEKYPPYLGPIHPPRQGAVEEY